MGAICRELMGDKIAKIFKKYIKEADIVITISGGVASVEKLGNQKLVIIDLDNADDYTSKEMTEELAEESGIFQWHQNSEEEGA